MLHKRKVLFPTGSNKRLTLWQFHKHFVVTITVSAYNNTITRLPDADKITFADLILLCVHCGRSVDSSHSLAAHC